VMTAAIVATTANHQVTAGMQSAKGLK